MSKLLFLLSLFLIVEFASYSYAEQEQEQEQEQESIISKEQKKLLEKEELRVQDTFPQYRTLFNHKVVQEEVYKEFLKTQKESASP